MSTDTLHSGKNKRLVPVLRFKEFDGEWSNFKIGDIATKVGSGSTPSGGNQVYQSYGVPFIRSQNVANNKLDLDDTHISEEINSKMNGSIVKPNDILLNITGASIGRTCVVPNNFERGNVNQHVCIIRLKDQFAPRFLQPFLSSQKGQKLVYEGQTGSGREGLNFKSIRLFKLRIPSLPEQKKIATFLSTIDKKIQQLTRKKTLLEVYKKGLMQQLFSGALRFKPAPQGSGHEEGKDYPDWEVKRLGEIAKRIAKKNTSNEIKLVLTNSASRGVVNQRDYFDKDIANQNNLNGYYIVSKDDFVYNPRVSENAPVGPIKRNKLTEGVMSPLYSVFRFNEDNLEYFEYYFETVNWHRYLISVGNIGARHDRMNIINSDFFKMPIPLPCEEEKLKISNCLSGIDEKLLNISEQITKTQSFKKGLLQQMFV